ncbi:MAG: hypothetical protein EOO20_05955 [Chryseobacterium sp.]|nr:MAG: hypothetical protein EOO20_05955 [Chryseobacterium sp.]
MEKKKAIFKDPEGNFAIIVSSEWKYGQKNEDSRKLLHQFEVSPGCVFQISSNPINEHISELIAKHKLLPHNFEFPNVSFVESYHQRPPMEMYQWMAHIGEHFFLAAFFFNPESKDKKDLGMELMEIRMALQNIQVKRVKDNDNTQTCPHFKPEVDSDYSDIENWRDPSRQFFKTMSPGNKPKTERISPLNIDALKLYALLTSKISHQPNGLFDLMKVNKPLDNPIWWDFVLECQNGFIQVWRTPFVLEASYSFDGEFDLEAFFISNIKKYETEIDGMIANFDRHTVYINHYESYRQCVETLWKEILEIDLTLPEPLSGHVTKTEEMDNYTKNVELFMTNSVKYHALAKSLVLNAAFKVESFLNLIIRIGSTPELRSYPDVLSKFTKQDFQSRVKSLRFYTYIFSADIDMSSSVYRETKELMTLRNKYVHYEEDTTHNRLGEIYYDRDYPLQPAEKNRPAIEATKNTYHHPDIDAVRKAYETSNNFVLMLQSLIHEEIRDSLLFLVEQNPIGYNEARGVYSSVYMPGSLDFFSMLKSD